MTNKLLMGILAGALAITLIGCGEFNDEPKAGGSTGGKITISLDALASQMGSTRALSSPGESGTDPTVTPIKGIIVGAIVTSRSQPYSTTNGITDSVQTELEDDLVNSVNYFQIVKLPTSEATIAFDIPPPAAGNWQIAALGVDPVPDFIADLGDSSKFDNAAKYYGFNEFFLDSDTVAGTTIKLSMTRSCLLDVPPKGCAQFDEDGNIKITDSVEILSVTNNGDASQFSGIPFPIIVRSTGSDSCVGGAADTCSATGAMALFSSIATAAGDSITVTTTHQESLRATDACAAAAPGQLDNNCVDKQVYTTPYF